MSNSRYESVDVVRSVRVFKAKETVVASITGMVQHAGHIRGKRVCNRKCVGVVFGNTSLLGFRCGCVLVLLRC
jgi:hypothetical protein